jgi:hypothetical protein
MISAIRAILTLIYAILSLITAIEIMIKGSFVVGLGVLVACTFSFFGTATFVGSFLARKEKAYRMMDLIGIDCSDPRRRELHGRLLDRLPNIFRGLDHRWLLLAAYRNAHRALGHEKGECVVKARGAD